MECTLLNTSFEGKQAGDAYLDNDWKCRGCGRLAAHHPAGNSFCVKFLLHLT
jgi:hypothetical protein